MYRILMILAAAAVVLAGPAAAASFDSVFCDSTLRVDLILTGRVPLHGAPECGIFSHSLSASPGWAGRRTRMAELPLEGNFQVTLTVASGDTIYRTSFSSLFSEWLTTGDTVARAMEHTLLLPLPRQKASLEVTACNPRREVMASMSFPLDPRDILIRRVAPPAVSSRVLHEGACGNPIDVALLAEGYTAEEADSFYIHAERAVEEILSYDPFSRHAGRFRFTAVMVPSRHTGVSVPRLGHWADTPFGSHFSTFYSDRYLTTPHVFAIHDALAGIPYEHVVILANCSEYGGGGIYNSYTLTDALHPMFRPVVVHEFGHSFGGLADEYFYDDDVMADTYPHDVEPWEPNITTLADTTAKWLRLLPQGTPVPTPPGRAVEFPLGVYEGGGYSTKGIYRPADECRMRNNTWPTFCPACRDALERLILFYTSEE